MKQVLKENARNIKKTFEDRYEIGGAWFPAYLAMHSPRSNVDKHFSQVVKHDFSDYCKNVAELISNRVASKFMLGSCMCGRNDDKGASKEMQFSIWSRSVVQLYQ